MPPQNILLMDPGGQAHFFKTCEDWDCLVSLKSCEYSLMVKLNLAKVMTRVRFPLFARPCSSKEEHCPVEAKVAVS